MNHAALVFITPLQRALTEQGVEIKLLRLGNLRSPFALRRTRTMVARMADCFDLVHAQYGSACAWASCANRSRPFIFTLRGNDWNLHSSSWHWLFFHTRLARFLSHKALRNSACVICVSHRLCSELRRFTSTDHTFYLPSPIDFTLFRTMDRIKARELAEPSRNPNIPWVLFNGINLADPIKRYDLAKSAVVEASRMCGYPIELITINHTDHNLVPMITAACDLILSTSETEGWPNCVKEALACDVPFVATDTSDLAEIAKVEPSCRIAHDSPRSLGAAICEVLDYCSNNRPCGLRRHIEHMELHATATRLRTLYESIIGGSA